MKKLVFFFLIFLSYNLFPQSWELMYKDSIMQYDNIYQDYGKLNIDELLIKGDSVIFLRARSDSILLIYDKSKKEFYHILKQDFWKGLKNDTLYNLYKKSDILNLFYDSKENCWFSCGDCIIQFTPDTAYIYSDIFVKELNKTFKIRRGANRTIRKIKEDKAGNIWFYLLSVLQDTDTTLREYSMLCKHTGSGIESVLISSTFYMFASKCNFVFDDQNRVWYVYGDSCYVIKDDVVEKKFTTIDAWKGYGSFSDLVMDSKGNFFATNNLLFLFKYDGDTLTVDRRLRDIEVEIRKTGVGHLYWMRIDSLDNIWITGYYSCYLYKIDTAGVISAYETPKFDTTGIEWCYKSLMEIDNNGKIWIPAQGSIMESYGIYVFDPDSTKTEVEERKESESKDFQIFPNPAQNEITLSIPENQNIHSISIFNSLGMEVKRIAQANIIGNSKITISTADFPNGLYHCSFVNQAGRITKSFVILR